MMQQLSLIKEKGINHISGYTAGDILALLEKHHSNDVFVAESKNGETWANRDLLKLDAWVMKRSYAHFATIGYEIKVSRQDFESDQKWIKYPEYCHAFNFVCPAGMIRSIDLPKGIGLIWVTQSGKLHHKLKPEYHQPDIEKLNRLLIYVVMSRSKVVSGNALLSEHNLIKERQEYIAKCNDKKELAYFVKGHVRKMVEEANNINKSIKSRENDVERFEEKLAKLGIVWESSENDWRHRNNVENEIELLSNQIDNYTLERIASGAHTILNTVDMLKKIKQVRLE